MHSEGKPPKHGVVRLTSLSPGAHSNVDGRTVFVASSAHIAAAPCTPVLAATPVGAAAGSSQAQKLLARAMPSDQHLHLILVTLDVRLTSTGALRKPWRVFTWRSCSHRQHPYQPFTGPEAVPHSRSSM